MSYYGEGNGTPLQYSCLENPMGRGAWWAAVQGVTMSRTWLSDFTFTFHFHALEKEMATHSSVLAWRIPGTEEPVGLPSMGSHRVGHDWSNLAAAAAAGIPNCSVFLTPSLADNTQFLVNTLFFKSHLRTTTSGIWSLLPSDHLQCPSVKAQFTKMLSSTHQPSGRHSSDVSSLFPRQ